MNGIETFPAAWHILSFMICLDSFLFFSEYSTLSSSHLRLMLFFMRVGCQYDLNYAQNVSKLLLLIKTCMHVVVFSFSSELPYALLGVCKKKVQ